MSRGRLEAFSDGVIALVTWRDIVRVIVG